MKIGEVKYRPNSHSIGKYNMDFKIESSNGNIVLSGGVLNKNEHEFNLNFHLGQKNAVL